MIINDPIKGVIVPDLSEYEVNNNKDVLDYIKKGNA